MDDRIKVKISVTLSEDLIAAIDASLTDCGSRSAFIEAAVREFIAKIKRVEMDKKDLTIINLHAEALNREANEVLEYQVLQIAPEIQDQS